MPATEDDEQTSGGSVRGAAAMFEAKITESQRTSTSNEDGSREFFERPSVGSVGAAKNMFQQKIDEQEKSVRVMKGEKEAIRSATKDETPEVRDDIRMQRMSDSGGGSVRDAATMFQQKIDTKEKTQQVLRGKKDEPIPEHKRNFTIKRNTEVEYDVEWKGCDGCARGAECVLM